ncbi:MAG: protein-tyrosine-phosphatase [Bacteroidetes bacterium]|nr:protein-tyrosine-phosphatase [Bacteroidota bacterium]
MKILFVCLGNICRSPLAEGILLAKAAEKGLDIEVESAGFESYHINEPPDERAVKICDRYGIDIKENKCRLFTVEDFDKFDRIYVMDSGNYRDVQYFSRHEEDMQKVSYLLSVIDGKNQAVPDPYYGGEEGFENVYQLINNACGKIVEKIEQKQL